VKIEAELAAQLVKALLGGVCDSIGKYRSGSIPDHERMIHDAEVNTIFLATTAMDLQSCVKDSLEALQGVKPRDGMNRVLALTSFMRALADRLDETKMRKCRSSKVMYPTLLRRVVLCCELPKGHEGVHKQGTIQWKGQVFYIEQDKKEKG